MIENLTSDFESYVRQKQHIDTFFESEQFKTYFADEVKSPGTLVQFFNLVFPRKFSSVLETFSESISGFLKNDKDFIFIVDSLNDDKRLAFLKSKASCAYLNNKTPLQFAEFYKKLSPAFKPELNHFFLTTTLVGNGLGDILAFVRLFPEEYPQIIKVLSNRIIKARQLKDEEQNFSVLKPPFDEKWWAIVAVLITDCLIDINKLPNEILPQNFAQLAYLFKSVGYTKNLFDWARKTLINNFLGDIPDYYKNNDRDLVVGFFKAFANQLQFKDLTAEKLSRILRNYDEQDWETLLALINWPELLSQPSLLHFINELQNEFVDNKNIINNLLKSLLNYSEIHQDFIFPPMLVSELPHYLSQLNREALQTTGKNLLDKLIFLPKASEQDCLNEWSKLQNESLTPIVTCASPQSQIQLLKFKIIDSENYWHCLGSAARVEVLLENTKLLQKNKQVDLQALTNLVNDLAVPENNRKKLAAQALVVHGAEFFEMNKVIAIQGLQEYLATDKNGFNNFLIATPTPTLKKIRDEVANLSTKMHDYTQRQQPYSRPLLEFLMTADIDTASKCSLTIGGLIAGLSIYFLWPVFAASFGAIFIGAVAGVIGGLFTPVIFDSALCFVSSFFEDFYDNKQVDSRLKLKECCKTFNSLDKVDELLLELNKIKLDEPSPSRFGLFSCCFDANGSEQNVSAPLLK